MPRDIGYNGQLYSLAGTAGRTGQGLNVTNYHLLFPLGYSTDNALGANSGRCWMLVQNAGTARVYYRFGSELPTVGDLFLDPGGVLQIDKQLPWTGSITFGSTAQIDLAVSEASLSGV